MPHPHLTRDEAISIHALREEGDYVIPHRAGFTWKFLSTPSARRATLPSAWFERPARISIHALREEGDHLMEKHACFILDISIHALREEGDLS